MLTDWQLAHLADLIVVAVFFTVVYVIVCLGVGFVLYETFEMIARKVRKRRERKGAQ